MRREAAKLMRRLAASVQQSHPDMTVHDHLRDAAKQVEKGNEEASQRHLRAAMFSLTPQSMMRNGLHTDEAHQAGRLAMHSVHRHLLLVKDIADASAKNQAMIRRDSGDGAAVPPPRPDPNAGYGPGANAQKPTVRQPPGDQALNAPAKADGGGSDPAVADPNSPQRPGSKQFGYGWGDLAAVIGLVNRPKVVDLVGPHGYIHGWIFVGIPVAGQEVYHPQHGRGTVTESGEGHVKVGFDAGHSASFPVRSGQSRGHFEQMTDDELAAEYNRSQGSRAKAVTDELDRRDQRDQDAADQAKSQRVSALYAEQPKTEADRNRVYQSLVNEGENPEDAWAHAHGTNAEAMQKQSVIADLRAQGHKGAGFDALTRDAFKDEVHRRTISAEGATNGYMLSPAGKKAGIDPWSLFTGPESRARKYASPELKEWFDQNGRPTVTDFQAQLTGRKAGMKPADFYASVTWDDVARVVELTGDADHRHIPGSPFEWKHPYIPLTEAAAESHAGKSGGKGTGKSGGSSKGGGLLKGMRTETRGGRTYHTMTDADGSGWVNAVRPGGGQAGALSWLPDGRIGDVHVTEQEQRKGVASEMLRQAQKATGGKVRHHAARTDDGEGFARATGGKVPPRSDVLASPARSSGSPHAAAAREIAGNVRSEPGLTRGQREEAELRLHNAAKHLDAGDHGEAAAELDAAVHASSMRGGGIIKGSTAAQARDLRTKVRAGHPVAGAAQQRGNAMSVTWDDLARVIEFSARTAALEVTPAPRGKPGGPGLYGAKGNMHSPYMQQVVKALIEKRGMDPGKAYAIAWSSLRKWEAKSKHPEVRAAATGGLGLEKAAEARGHAHSVTRDDVELAVELAPAAQARVPAGQGGGGQFTAGGGGQPDAHQQHVAHVAHVQAQQQQGQQKSAASATAGKTASATAKSKIAASQQSKAGLVQQAAGYRAKADALIAQRKALQAQLASASGAVSSGQSGSTTSSGASTTSSGASTTASTAPAAGTTAAAATPATAASTTTTPAAGTTALTAAQSAQIKVQVAQMTTQIIALQGQYAQAMAAAAKL